MRITLILNGIEQEINNAKDLKSLDKTTQAEVELALDMMPHLCKDKNEHHKEGKRHGLFVPVPHNMFWEPNEGDAASTPTFKKIYVGWIGKEQRYIIHDNAAELMKLVDLT